MSSFLSDILQLFGWEEKRSEELLETVKLATKEEICIAFEFLYDLYIGVFPYKVIASIANAHGDAASMDNLCTHCAQLDKRSYQKSFSLSHEASSLIGGPFKVWAEFKSVGKSYHP